METRKGSVQRTTMETAITCSLSLDQEDPVSVSTGIGFLDHLVRSIACHSRMGLELKAEGDLQVDDHHTVEDCGLVLGEALRAAVGDKAGIARFGSAFAPLDEALSRCVIDLSGRAFSRVRLRLKRDRIGDLACENIAHFFQSIAQSGALTLHLDVLRGQNDHHKAEAAAKAFAIALRAATQREGGRGIPSTKGVLS